MWEVVEKKSRLGKCRAKYRRLIGFNMFGRYIKDSIVVAPTMPQNDYFCSGSHFSLHPHPPFPMLGISFPYTLTLLILSSVPLFPTLSPSFSYARSLSSLCSHTPFPTLGPSLPYTLTLLFLRSDPLFQKLSSSFSLHSVPLPTLGLFFPYTLSLLFLCSDPLFPTFSPSFSNARSLFSLHSLPTFPKLGPSFPYVLLLLCSSSLTPVPTISTLTIFPRQCTRNTSFSNIITHSSWCSSSFFFLSLLSSVPYGLNSRTVFPTLSFSPLHFHPFPYTLNLFSYCSYFLFPAAIIRLSLNWTPSSCFHLHSRLRFLCSYPPFPLTIFCLHSQFLFSIHSTWFSNILTDFSRVSFIFSLSPSIPYTLTLFSIHLHSLSLHSCLPFS
jgi:hypothetical protein